MQLGVPGFFHAGAETPGRHSRNIPHSELLGNGTQKRSPKALKVTSLCVHRRPNPRDPLFS